jgi:hypothetical protein
MYVTGTDALLRSTHPCLVPGPVIWTGQVAGTCECGDEPLEFHNMRRIS